jgi:excinuclease ABC subunit C
MLDSVLDEVSGIGPTRKKALLKRFGSLTRLRNASEDEMAAVIPAAVASQLYAALHGGDDGSRQ